MTAMPQMVALFNGVGGGGAALIALAEYHRIAPEPGRAALAETIAIALSLVIGAISFAGSLVAFAKLQELIGGRPITYPGQKAVNALIAAAVVVLAASISFSDGESRLVAAGALALLLGVLFVLPIGGADMPVVISLLNSFTGIAAAASGLRPAQRPADRLGLARRRLRHAADADDGPGHEPPAHERALRRLRHRRRRAGRGRVRARPAAACARSARPTPPCCWPTPTAS